MNSSQLINTFCPRHADTEAPISVITDILAEKDPFRFETISNEFKILGFTKVKDLARATLGKASTIKLNGDSLMLLYGAIEIYTEQIDNLFKSAKLENQNGNFIKTQQICEELLKQKPTDLNVLLLIAESFFNCGNYEKCIDYLEIAKNVNPNCYEVYSNLAMIYSKKSKNDLAKHYYSEACLRNPFCTDIWTNYADCLFHANDLASAEMAYNRVLGLKPKLFDVHNKYGKLLLSLKEIKKAKQQFKIAQKYAPEFEETLNNLGNVYFMTRKFDKAISNYQKVLELNPNQKMTLINMGLACYKVAEYQKAVDAFQKVIELDPENFSVLGNLAAAYFHQENISLAVETYEMCIICQPDNVDINLDLALVYFHLKNFQKAEHFLKICIQLNPQRKDLYKHLSNVYQESKQYINASNIYISLGDLCMDDNDQENAREAYDFAIQLNPENAIGHWKVGRTMYNLGDFNLAIIRYRKAISLKPNFPDAYCDCGVAYQVSEDSERALEYYEMAILLQPEHLSALVNLYHLKHELCQFDGIIDLRQRILQIDELFESETFGHT